MKLTARRRAFTLALLAALSAAAQPAGAGAQQAPLPEFAVKTLDGEEVQSGELSTQQRWLLVYVRPNCAPCEDVFKVFRQITSQSGVTGKVVVVVGGATLEEANGLAARVPWLPRQVWHVDVSKRAAAALSVKGAPTVYGVLQGKVEWDLKGATDGPRRLKSILQSWSEQ